MAKDLVFVGAGHAHLTSLKNLSTFQKGGHRVTVISPSPYQYYSGMGPGMLGGIYQPWEARFHIKKMAEDRGAVFVKDKVVRVDPERRLLTLAAGGKIRYDVVSFNTGSEVFARPLAPEPREDIIAVKPVVNLLGARQAILGAPRGQKPLHLAVVGGGPAGVEIAANLWRLLRETRAKGEITLIAGKKLLGEAPGPVRLLAQDSLTRRGLQVIEGAYAQRVENGGVILDDRRKIPFDKVFVATGVGPSPLFGDSGLPTAADGGLLVNAYLQSVVHQDVFGGGDCVHLDGTALARVGVHAVRQNPILHHNLLAALDGGEMIPFKPQEHFMLILNMGDGRGIFWKKSWVWQGRLAFLLKDYIDRGFMKKFQVSGEREEQSDRLE